MNGHQNENYATLKIWTKFRRTKFRRTKFFVGQNFRRTKLFDGQNFRHQAKISTLLSVEFLSDKVSKGQGCMKFWANNAYNIMASIIWRLGIGWNVECL